VIVGVFVGARRVFDVDAGIAQEERRVNVGGDHVVSSKDVLEVYIDEIIEGVDMLLDQAFDLQKGWEKFPLVLGKYISISCVVFSI